MSEREMEKKEVEWEKGEREMARASEKIGISLTVKL